MATPPILSSLISSYAEGCGVQEAESASLDQTCSAWAKVDKTKEWTDYLSNKQIAVLWEHAGCPLSGVERCPLLGGSKCTISTGRAIGGMEFVRCTEVVRLSEGPLLGVSL